MVEKSILWTTGSTGDGTTEYTQSEVIRWLRQAWLADNTTEGPLKGYSGELEVTGSSSPVAVAAGGAFVYGFPYWSTASENVAIPTPSSLTRIDRIVLRASWAAQTVRIVRLAGSEGGAAPALTQSDGTTWEISIAQCSITTGGAITVTDEREWARPNIGVDENMLDASVAGDALTGGDGTPLAVAVGAGLEISGDTVRIAAAAAGDGIKGGAGSALDIEPADFAGAGLEDDGADNLRIAAAAAGDGLQGGAGSALSVDVSDIAGTGLEDDGSENLRIAAAAAGDGLQGGAGSAIAVDVSDFAGAGLEDDGSENLRIAAAAAGNGLIGGGGSALAVNPDGTTLDISGDAIRVTPGGIGASQIADWFKTWLVQPIAPGETYTLQGVALPDSVTTEVWGYFYLDPNYAYSGITITPIVLTTITGANYLYIELNIQFSELSEVYTTHSQSSGPSQYTGGTLYQNMYREWTTMTVSGESAGDFIRMKFTRHGGHGSDTHAATAYLLGFLIQATAIR